MFLSQFGINRMALLSITQTLFFLSIYSMVIMAGMYSSYAGEHLAITDRMKVMTLSVSTFK